MTVMHVGTPGRRGHMPRRLLTRLALTLGCVLVVATPVPAADMAEAEKLFRTGKYAECEQLAADEIAKAYRKLARQHHPDILVRWNKVTLSLSTHDAGGITTKDFDLAAEADGIATGL